LFNTSVEGPMGGPAYSGTYSAANEYLGIFDSKTCYTYNSSGVGASGMNGRFEPSTSGVANHLCGTNWSGNFLNWATMRAIDMLIWNLTGGNRVRDTAGALAETVLRVARINTSWFGSRTVTVPAGAAPASGNQTITYPGDYTFNFNGTTYNIQVLVCKTASPGPESNCVAYTDNASTPNTYKKPEGLIQKNAEKMRFALTSYTLDNTQERDGGVLRSNMKYVGPRKWDDTNRAWIDNDAKEWWGTAAVTGTCSSPNPTTPGLLIANPEQCNQDSALAVPASSGLKSGIIAYINQFSDQGYKSYDPASELFYESLNYFRQRGPTPEYSGADTANGRTLTAIGRTSTENRTGGFWFYNQNSEWKDPITYSCQRNFIIGINDANPWLDKRLPGTYFTVDKTVGNTGAKWRGTAACQGGADCNVVAKDYGQPSGADTINVTTLTNQVGSYEGLNGINWSTTGYYPGIIYNGTPVTATINDAIRGILWQKDSVGGSVVSSGNGTFDNSCSGKMVSALGEVFGTCGYPAKQNSYYIAGLAYWANTTDIRSDLTGKQTVNTFMIDTQEPQPGSNILDGPRNMLWLTGKYGGFIDKNNNSQPDLQEEWNKTGTGIPDNYLFASDPQKLKDGLTNAFDNIYDLSATTTDTSSSAVAANSTRLDTGSVVYQMKFSPLDWTGQVIAEKLNTDGTINSVLWNTDTTLGRLTPSAAASRQMFSWNPTTNTGSQFKCSGTWMDPTKISPPDNVSCWLTSTQRTALRETSLTAPLPSGVNWDDLLKYLRGDPTNETDQTGRKSFRYRSMTLGDIINSDPLFVGDENLGYEVLPDADGGGSSYAAYRFGTEARQKMLYVGANDGMLHAFDATTGAEVFTYVPNEVIQDSTNTQRMKLLAALNYSHKYFVDGSPNFSDVYTGGAWKTYLVASQGGGGRAIFALDISAETNGTIIMSPSKVLWEFGPNSDTNSGTKSSEIGYVLSQPAVARLPNKRWAAFFGNGPGGSSGKAKLFAIYLDANITDTNKWELGKDYLVFDTDNTTSNASITSNGLSGVSVVGDNYQTGQTVYAGDLLGRMWKFDVSGITSANISCSSGCGSGTLVFTTQLNQPITTAPAIGTHSKCGVMLYFGTGKYYETGDQTNVDLQTLYGIWDQPGGTAISGTTNLYEYQIDKQGTAASGTEWRVIADNNSTKITDIFAPASISGTPDVCKSSNPDAPKKRGWFIDLKVKGTTLNTGERVVTPALLRHGRAIFTTLDPSKTFCAGGGKSWVMEITAESGAPLTSGVFDINKDNTITSTVTTGDCGDCVVNSAGLSSLASGVSTGNMGIIKTPTVLTAGGVEYKLGSGSTAGELVVIKEKGTSAPRASWRQLQ
jgi:type IV pilus assembly protein PilY1